MPQMIFFLRYSHASIRRLYERFPASSSLPSLSAFINRGANTCNGRRVRNYKTHSGLPDCFARHRPCTTLSPSGSGSWGSRNCNILGNLLGLYVVTAQKTNLGLFGSNQKFSYVTTTNPPTSTSSTSGSSTTQPQKEADDNSPMNMVLQQIRIQERIFKNKLNRDNTARSADMKGSLVDEVASFQTYHTERTPPASTPSSVEEFNVVFERSPSVPSTSLHSTPLTSDNNRLTQIFTHSDPPLSGVRNRIDKKLSVPLVPPKSQVKEPFKELNRKAQMPLPTPRIVFPKHLEKPSIAFKMPKKPHETSSKLQSSVFPPSSSGMPPPVTPKFTESTTQRVKTLLDNSIKPSETIASDLNSLQYKVDVKNRILKLFGQDRSTDTKSIQSTPSKEVEIFKGPVDILGNPVPPPESKLITSMMNKELNVVPVEDKEYGGQKDQDDDGKKNKKSGKSKKWKGVKYTLGFLGLASTCIGSYSLFQIGKPKYDENGNIILDKYSHMPVIFQYFHRIKDEFDSYNKMIKEPSREKLLPDVLQPPYYQPPYTLVVEFTDLLVHPEWTYKTGWRFKKRPGVDQFLEALYTRFEVVVYTAQMGMTVFPILEVLDNKNLISYKLVRDATNFVDGDHVKDLDKLNRDLSKVVVIDWNPQSVKLHKCNLFKIPRWEGNDDDRTLYDLAAFLIAISEWEVQDVRTVLEYYAQFDNPLLKFKENQMHVLRATQS